jgi:AbrB family looped-hinge helix DNA binding protein
MTVSKISRKGQVTLPRKIRQAIGAKPGDTIAYEVRRGMVILRKVDPFDAAYHAAIAKTLTEWASPEDDEAFRDL